MIRTSCLGILWMRVWCFLWLEMGFGEAGREGEEIGVLPVGKLVYVLGITDVGGVCFVGRVEHGGSWVPLLWRVVVVVEIPGFLRLRDYWLRCLRERIVRHPFLLLRELDFLP